MSSFISKLINLAGNITGTLPVSNGGTGVTTSTGSTNVVLSGSPTITTPIIATINNTAGVAIQGANTNSSASAGYVGEELLATVSRVTTGLTSGASFDITSLSITAGDWELFPQFSLSSGDAVTTSKIISWVSTTSATLPANSTWQNISFLKLSGVAFANDDIVLALAPARISVASTTTYYFSCQITWSGVATNQGAWGRFAARRLR